MLNLRQGTSLVHYIESEVNKPEQEKQEKASPRLNKRNENER